MVMTDGGPNDLTLFYVLNLYRQAFEFHNMGYASALAWVLFVHPARADDPGLPRVEEPGLLRGAEDVTTCETLDPGTRPRAVRGDPDRRRRTRGGRAGAASAAAAARSRRTEGTVVQRRREKIIAYSILIVGALLFLIPFYFVVNASLKTAGEVEAGDFVTPADVSASARS